MKIVNNRNISKVKCGECCIVAGDVFIKLNDINDEDYQTFNAVNLADGRLCRITEYANVEPVNAKLVIE